MGKFRWCFIGAGGLANSVAKVITDSGRHEIVSVYTRSIEKGIDFAKKYGANAYETAREAIMQENVDGVYVVTPHDSHYKYAKISLEAKKPVLVEKAFTVNYAQAKELFDLAEKNNVYISEAMWTWFNPIANKVKSWIDEGEIGEILDTDIMYRVNVRNFAPRLTDPNMAGGCMLDSGVYPLTYLYRIFGKPDTVLCKGKLENGIDISEYVEFIYENKYKISIPLSIDAENWDEFFEVRGSQGKIRVDDFHGAEEAFLEMNSGEHIKITERTTMLNEFDEVVNEIQMGLLTSKFVPKESTLDVMEIMDECRKQMGLVYPFEAI